MEIILTAALGLGLGIGLAALSLMWRLAVATEQIAHVMTVSHAADLEPPPIVDTGRSALTMPDM
jgi:hypothetical protein